MDNQDLLQYNKLQYDDQDQMDETQLIVEDDYITDEIENELSVTKTVRFEKKPEIIEPKSETEINEHMTNVSESQSSISSSASSSTSASVVSPSSAPSYAPSYTSSSVVSAEAPATIMGTSGSSSLLSFLCLFIFMLLIAYLRGDLTNKDGSLNLMMLLCVLIFPQFYVGFAIVDYATGHTRDIKN